MANAKIRPPVELKPRNRLPKKFVTDDYVRDPTPMTNFVQIRPRGGGGGVSRQMGEVKRIVS